MFLPKACVDGYIICMIDSATNNLNNSVLNCLFFFLFLNKLFIHQFEYGLCLFLLNARVDGSITCMIDSETSILNNQF